MRLLYLGFLAGGMAGGQLALAETLSTGITARTLESHNSQETDREMVLREVTISPGVIVPLHHHTVPGLSSLLRASPNKPTLVIHRVSIAPEKTLQDRADVPHTLFRNADPNRPSRILTFYVAAKG
jgi:hypothetical protein